MPNIIREKSAVASASLEDLNHTYRELRGEPDFEGFASEAEARVQVQMAIMASQDAVGHMGVKPNQKPQAKTVAELGFNPFKEGTLSHKLHAETAQQAPIQPRPTKAEKPKGEHKTKPAISVVKATGKGESKVQQNSMRANILTFIQNSPKATCTVAALEEKFKQPVRGYLQKLIEKKHLVVVS